MVKGFIQQIYDCERRALIVLDFIIYGGPTLYETNRSNFKKAKQKIYQRYTI